MSKNKQVINIDNHFFVPGDLKILIFVENNVLNVFDLYVFFIGYIMQLTVCYE